MAGEVKTRAKLAYEAIVPRVTKQLGCNNPIYNFDYPTVDVEVLVHEQSPDIARGVDPGGD